MLSTVPESKELTITTYYKLHAQIYAPTSSQPKYVTFSGTMFNKIYF